MADLALLLVANLAELSRGILELKNDGNHPIIQSLVRGLKPSTDDQRIQDGGEVPLTMFAHLLKLFVSRIDEQHEDLLLAEEDPDPTKHARRFFDAVKRESVQPELRQDFPHAHVQALVKVILRIGELWLLGPGLGGWSWVWFGRGATGTASHADGDEEESSPG
jgi:hypothetical protein